MKSFPLFYSSSFSEEVTNILSKFILEVIQIFKKSDPKISERSRNF